MTAPIRIPVGLGERSYDVLVGPGARNLLAEALAAALPAAPRRVAVVTAEGIGVDTDAGEAAGATRTFTVPAGERFKTLATVEELCRRFARFGLTRGDAVVAVGGGQVTDVAGFAAAVYHRGVPVAFVPTTLLGQIDAAIGGKTGVNLPEGKNLVGAFWQPAVVLCDPDVLATLPEAEYRSGLGEMAKYHFLPGGDGGPIDAAAMAGLPLVERIARCVRLKAEIVGSDERESGRRMLLNYGHTLAHALEIAGGFDLRHGEAVAVGLIYAAEVARRLGRIDDGRVAEHRQVVSAYGLPATLPAGVDPAELIDLFGRDKKAVGGLTLVLDGPRGGRARARRRPGGPGRIPGGDPMNQTPTPVILLLSGPNLQLLGRREPEVYGHHTLDDHVRTATAAAAEAGFALEHLQSNHEGDLVDAVGGALGRAAAIVINAGALSHYSWALHDALAAFDGPVVELHLSNPYARDAWRHRSVIAPVADGVICGLGGPGYRLAVEAAAELASA